MTKLNHLHDLLVHELKDLYSAESQLVKALPKMAKAASNPDLNVVATDESRIGGLDGHIVEVENPGPGPASIVEVPPGTLIIDPGRSLWVAFFDTPDGLLAVMVGGSTEQWDEALAAAEPILETVTIGE